MKDISRRQLKQVEQFKKLEAKKIPEDLDYEKVGSLRIEARQKLEEYRPVSIGQASQYFRRITGGYLCTAGISGTVQKKCTIPENRRR